MTEQVHPATRVDLDRSPDGAVELTDRVADRAGLDASRIPTLHRK